MAAQDPNEPSIRVDGLSLRQRGYAARGTISGAEWALYNSALALVPNDNLNIIQLAQYLLDLSYQFKRTALPVITTARGNALLRIADNLNARINMILHINTHLLPDTIPGRPDFIEPFGGQIRLTSAGPNPLIPPLLFPQTQLGQTQETNERAYSHMFNTDNNNGQTENAENRNPLADITNILDDIDV